MSSQALIDKIIKTAEAEAEQITDEILRRAADNEKTMLDKAEAEVARINKVSDEKCAQIKRISELTSGLQARKAKLHARRTVLEEAFAEAYKMILSQPDQKRLEYIKKLIIKYAPDKKLTVKVAENDLPLLDEKAKADIKEALGADAELTFEADKKIKGGVYLISELSDVDATLDSIFEELHDKYEAEADMILFPSQGKDNV